MNDLVDELFRIIEEAVPPASADQIRAVADAAAVKHLDAGALESFTANILVGLGYKSVEKTSNGPDGGIDVTAKHKGKFVVVQCKQHSKAVGRPVLQQLYGAGKILNADRFIVVAPRGFSKQARRYAENCPIELWTAEDLIRLASDEN